MAKKRKANGAKQIAIIVLILIGIELAYLFLIPRPSPQSPRQAIQTAVDSQQGLDPKRKELMRVQLALSDYQSNHEGVLPDKLDELVPLYFDTLPRNPETGDAFVYTVTNGVFRVTSDGVTGPTKGDGKNSSPGGTLVIPASIDDPVSENVQKALLKTFDEGNADSKAQFVYDPTGKRDPFKPFDFAPQPKIDESKPPLERYDINQLKLTAVVAGINGAKIATVENAAGRGFAVRKGTKIGLNSGEVVEILTDKLLILETSKDFTGTEKTKTIELRLRTKDQEERLKGNQ